jgi:hypothetical protein
MGRRGNRSDYSKQRRYLSRLVSRSSYICENREAVNIMTQADIYDALVDAGFTPRLSLCNSMDVGEVLSDGRGLGSLQRMIDDG